MFKEINIAKVSKISLLGTLIVGGLGVSSSNAAPKENESPFTIQAPSVPVPTRALVNPSFESPYFPNARAAWIPLDNYTPGNKNTLQGWFSTHPSDGFPDAGASWYRHSDGTKFEHVIELWANGHNNVYSPVGTQHIELNAAANSAVYQDILVFQGEQIPWSAAHRGRSSSSVADVAEVFISNPADWTGATFNGARLYSANISTSNDGSVASITPINGNVPSSTSINSLGDGWVQYSDVWSGPFTSRKYRFAFQAVSSARGNSDFDLTFGNLLDNIQIKLSPVVDFVDPEIDKLNPLTNSIYYLPVRINGQSKSKANIEIDVSLDGSDFTNFKIGSIASGSGKSVANGVTAIKLNNGNVQVTIPANLYDPNNPDDYVLVPIDFAQSRSSSDQIATFEFVDVNGGGGEGVQALLIPPGDSGLTTSLSTEVLASLSAD